MMNAADPDTLSVQQGSPVSTGLSSMNEPIAALATAPGAAAIAIVRVSGHGCLPLLEACLQRVAAGEPRPRTLHRAFFLDPASAERIDDLMVVTFCGPASFTGEDSAELYCHGGPYIVQRLLQTLWRGGFRPAEPGEFTRRAFINGKLDLTAAEGIKQLVEASTHQQWLAARQLASGRFAVAIEALRASLIEALAYLAARIDFPDEGDTQGVHMHMVRERVEKVFQRIESLERSYASGKVAAQGLLVAIIGRPNMGKSTLLNSLLGHERAIVTAEAGTTRDYLEEPCRIRGRLIRLVDTAGVREASDTAEKLGVEHSLRLAGEADLVLLLVAADASDEDRRAADELAQRLGPEKCLMILSKADRGVPAWARQALPLSCLTASGLEQLEEAIVRRVDGYLGQLSDEPFVSSARHLSALQTARRDLEAFFAGESAGQYDELLAFELQNAARALSSILGTVDVEDVLDKVFRDFCVGK